MGAQGTVFSKPRHDSCSQSSGGKLFFFFSIPFWYKSEKGLQFGVANPREYRDSILQAVILTI